MFNRNDMLLVGGIRPHLYCPPILNAIFAQQVTRTGCQCFTRAFPGTDSAPHSRHRKETQLRLRRLPSTRPPPRRRYAAVFEEMNALAHFEAFLFTECPAIPYGLPVNTGGWNCLRDEQQVPENIMPL